MGGQQGRGGSGGVPKRLGTNGTSLSPRGQDLKGAMAGEGGRDTPRCSPTHPGPDPELGWGGRRRMAGPSCIFIAQECSRAAPLTPALPGEGGGELGRGGDGGVPTSPGPPGFQVNPLETPPWSGLGVGGVASCILRVLSTAGGAAVSPKGGGPRGGVALADPYRPQGFHVGFMAPPGAPEPSAPGRGGGRGRCRLLQPPPGTGGMCPIRGRGWGAPPPPPPSQRRGQGRGVSSPPGFMGVSQRGGGELWTPAGPPDPGGIWWGASVCGGGKGESG